eukprot:gene9112-10059_t
MNNIEEKQRQAHEKLRIDHIKTLEELARYKTENENLHQQLKFSIPITDETEEEVEEDRGGVSSSSVSDPISVPNTTCSLIDYVEKLRAKDKEISELKSAMRRKKNSIDEEEENQRQSSQQSRLVEDLSVQLQKMFQREKELQGQVIQLQSQIASVTTVRDSQRLTIEDEMTQLRSQLSVCQEAKVRVETMEEENASLRSQLAVQSSLAESRAKDILLLTEEKDKLGVEITQLTFQLKDLVELRKTCFQCESKQSLILSQCETIERLRKEVDNCRMTIKRLESPSPKREESSTPPTFHDSDTEGEEATTKPSSFCMLLQGKVSSNQETSSSKINEERKNPADDENSVNMAATMNVRFQEFIRLKRENQELKLRLADLNSSGGFPSPKQVVLTDDSQSLSISLRKQRSSTLLRKNNTSARLAPIGNR